MSTPIVYSFRPQAGAETPFDAQSEHHPTLGVSGSKWGLEQVEALFIDFQLEPDVEKLFSPESRISSTGKVGDLLTQSLDRPWTRIKTEYDDENSQSVYNWLSSLAKPNAPESEYIPSSPLTGPSSPNQQFSPLRPVRLWTPHSTLSSSPRPIPTPDRPQFGLQPSASTFFGPAEATQASTTPPEIYAQDFMDSSPPALLQTPDRSLRQLDEEEASRIFSSSPSHPSDCSPSQANNSFYNSSDDDLKARNPLEDKPEKVVEAAVMPYMGVVLDAFHKACKRPDNKSGRAWDLEARYVCEKRQAFYIDRYKISSDSDMTYAIKVFDLSKGRNRTVRMIMECKRAVTGLSADREFGQEVSELFSEAVRLKDKTNKHDDSITTFLLSWHHLECYITRLDVTKAYLEQLADTRYLHTQRAPRVIRSRYFNLKDDQDRVEYAIHCARIGVEILCGSDGPRELGVIKHLRR